MMLTHQTNLFFNYFLAKKQLNNEQEILQKYVNTYVNSDFVEVEVTYEVLENIGTKEKIVF